MEFSKWHLLLLMLVAVYLTGACFMGLRGYRILSLVLWTIVFSILYWLVLS